MILNSQSRPSGRHLAAAALIAIFLLCNQAAAAEMIPFVIGADANPDSLIAVEAAEPITANSPRLRVAGDSFQVGVNGRKVRLWGVNLSFGANMPKKIDAPRVADRLAAAGVNTIRIHHLDTARWPRGIWSASDGRNFEPQALDRLDYFINELARRGIWINFNLHVGRAHSRHLDPPQPNTKYDKIVGIFTPKLIDAQKDFARKIINHVNPYRNVRYGDDPAMAIFEITNEDSFFMWSGDKDLRALPVFYEKILRDKFNTWLRKKYKTDRRLRTAWSQGAEPLGLDLLKNGSFAVWSGTRPAPSQWHPEQHDDCRMSVSRRTYKGKPAVKLEIKRTDDTEWHLQFKQSGIELEKGKYYTVTFAAAASAPRAIGCSVSQAHDPWANMGLSRRPELTSDWSEFTCGFVASADESDARLSFAVGGSDADVYLANVRFRPGGILGLAEGESLIDSTVKVFGTNESMPRSVDRMIFLAETEKAYFDGMRNHIKRNLRSRALVTGTIVFGPLGLYVQSDMDYIDAHAYWQHPRFPRKPWDRSDWLIDQKPMTDFPEQATLFRLAAERLSGKPFTVSEYNHPAPLDSQAECVPLIASFAAAQNWSGVWLYTYSHSSDEWSRESLNSYFDIDTNPAKWGFMRAGTAIFRDRAMAPLTASLDMVLARTSNPLVELAELHLTHDRNMFAALADEQDITHKTALSARMAASLTGAPASQLSNTGRPGIEWFAERGSGFYSVDHGDAAVYTGHAEYSRKATQGRIAVTTPDFLALTITPIDESGRMLITACGRCENTGMVFSEDRRTVGLKWGTAPVLIEPIDAEITLPQGRWTCRALAPDGTSKRNVPVTYSGDEPKLHIAPEYATMWYLLIPEKR